MKHGVHYHHIHPSVYVNSIFERGDSEINIAVTLAMTTLLNERLYLDQTRPEIS